MGVAEPYCKCPRPEPVTKLVPVYQCPACFKNRNDAPPQSDFTEQKLHELWMRHPPIVITPENRDEIIRRTTDPTIFAPLLDFIWPRIEWEVAAARIIGYVEGYRAAQLQAQQLTKGEDDD